MADKSSKKAKAKKQNAIQRWWRETVGELRKVTWPTPQEAIPNDKNCVGGNGFHGYCFRRTLDFVLFEIDRL